MRSQSLVYLAICSANGKVYVGITSGSLETRIRKHVNAAGRGSTLHFHRALRKYGRQGFHWSVLKTAISWEDACALERQLIVQYEACNPSKGYNLTGGGEGSFGLRIPETTRRKISDSLKAWHASGDPKAAQLRRKVSTVRKTLKSSLETRLKHAQAASQRTHSRESRLKISQAHRKYSDSLVFAAVQYASQYSYHSAERVFGIPRPTIRRWSQSGEVQEEARRKESARHRKRKYGYAFPLIDFSLVEPDSDVKPPR